MSDLSSHTFLAARDYDLDATLLSGQAFRWEVRDGWWEGVVQGRWVRLVGHPDGIRAEAAIPVADWRWLADYLQSEVRLDAVVSQFPDDPPLRAAVAACHGLRLLRQDPWECLASFILSSTKQIVQIRQMVAAVCERFGERVPAPAGRAPQFAFPPAAQLAATSESELRACKMGFRAPYLLATARRVASGDVDLAALGRLDCEAARAELERLPGVGRKIADCVLLFAYGFPEAFPVDVWVMKALRQLYFPGRRVPLPRLRRFAASHFGPHAGYAQQYLFHYMRVKQRTAGRAPAAVAPSAQRQAA
jgi:N-glycosylase/DNA lyase